MTHHLLVACHDGVRQLALDLPTGRAETVGPVLPLSGPLAINPDPRRRGTAWAVAREPGGRITAVTATADGVVAGASAATGGDVPCHTAVVGPEALVVANYSGHTVGVVRTGDDSAELVRRYGFGEDSHPHQVLELEDRLLVSDLGRDGLHVLATSDVLGPGAGGQVADPPAIPLEAGAGPRDAVAIGPDHLVVALERANAAAVVELDRDAGGSITGGRQVDRCGFTGEIAKTHPSQILVHRPGGDAADSPVAGALVLNRGTDQLCVTEVADGRFSGPAVEHPLPAWPMDLIRIGEVVLVACRDGEVLVALSAAEPGRELFRVPVPRPNGLCVVDPG